MMGKDYTMELSAVEVGLFFGENNTLNGQRITKLYTMYNSDEEWMPLFLIVKYKNIIYFATTGRIM